MSKKVYDSKYTNNKVTDSQYLTDFICERIANKEKNILPYKYWNTDRWKKIFLAQLTHANALLKELDCITIMATLRSYKGLRIYSLGLRKQILEYSKQVNFHPNSILTNTNFPCEQNLDDLVIYEEIEEIPEEEIDEPKANLWTKLA